MTKNESTNICSGENMVEVKRIRIRDGYDCWGNAEYMDVYVVTDKCGKVIYKSEDDPTELINILTNKK